MIEIKSLNKYFNKGKGNEIHVLNDVNITLPERGMVAVFGKSGCGKTTLLNVIGGLDDYAGGSISIENNDICKNTDDIRNRYIGYIFQNYNLNLGETCYDNVADALRLCGITDREQTKSRVFAALKTVGMDKFANRTPDTLSGGQQQRVAIARAIVKNPRVILADEPTGNLDESNTLAVMNLLRAIAEEHLVVLVTHEQNLVDHYCDTVIELSDGKVVNTYENRISGSYKVRDKNAVYLGELKKNATVSENVEIEYYGETPPRPIKLKIVNSGGKTYLQIDSAGVNVLDSGSEVRLLEGSFKHEEESEKTSTAVDMSELPPIAAEKCGKLFTLSQAIKSGYTENFKKGKKGKGFFRVCMILFAMVFVLVSAIFGTSFYKIIQVKNSYNDSVFYVNIQDDNMGQILNGAIKNGDGAIDGARLQGDLTVWSIDSVNSISFDANYFETFSSGYRGFDGRYGGFAAAAVILQDEFCRDLSLVEGKKTDLKDYEMVITTAVADNLLKASKVGFISKYSDLIGINTLDKIVNNERLTIVGIVRSSENAAYLNEMTAADYAMSSFGSYVRRGSIYGIDVSVGETICTDSGANGESYPGDGGKIYIHGKEFTFKVGQVSRAPYYTYESYCEAKKHELIGVDEYLEEKIRTEYPGASNEVIVAKMPEYKNLYFYEAVDNYYKYANEFIAYNLRTSLNYNEQYAFWLANKDIPVAEAYLLSSYSLWQGIRFGEFWRYKEHYAQAGEYLTRADFAEDFPYPDDADYVAEDRYYTVSEQYKNEYNDYYSNNVTPTGFFVSDSDYVELSKCIGKTFIRCGGYYNSACGYDIVNGKEVFNDISEDNHYGASYFLIHSSSPKVTEKFLNGKFASYDNGSEIQPIIITPKMVYNALIEDSRIEIIAGLIALVVVIVLLSLCMYFMVRSSFMTRVKQIGIYRAIGASKKNVLFKFFIESLVLTLLTVFIGYLIASIIIGSMGSSAIMATLLYYPAWLAICALVVLMGISILFGILPALILLKKTPSKILAKYDI